MEEELGVREEKEGNKSKKEEGTGADLHNTHRFLHNDLVVGT